MEQFENFFMGFGVPISLSVADIFRPISTRSRWGTWMHNAHGCISGLILHGAFQTKFLGILYHKLSTFMLIRRGTGSFKCYFQIFEILGNYGLAPLCIIACMVRRFAWISLLSVAILSNPFNWRKVLSGAKGCHLVWLVI